MAAGFALFVKALATKETMQSFAEGLKSTAEIAANAKDQITSTQLVSRLITALNPFMPVIQEIVNQIVSGSLDSSMELMNTLFKLIETEAFQKGLKTTTEAVEKIFQILTWIVEQVMAWWEFFASNNEDRRNIFADYDFEGPGGSTFINDIVEWWKEQLAKSSETGVL